MVPTPAAEKAMPIALERQDEHDVRIAEAAAEHVEREAGGEHGERRAGEGAQVFSACSSPNTWRR